MTQELLISVDNYITDLFIPVDAATEEANADREDAELQSASRAERRLAQP